MVLNWWKSLLNRKFGPRKQLPRRQTPGRSGTIRLLIEPLEPRISLSVSSTVNPSSADGSSNDTPPSWKAGAYSVTVSDFNRDGKQDLAAVDAGGVSVLLGNGAGGFAAPVTYAAGNSSIFVAVADFNRDGKQDLAVANAAGVCVLLGNGAGGFEPGLTSAAGTGPTSLAAGD